MVNATQLSSFLYCPRKLFIKSVLLVEEPLKEELVKGTIWHSTYEFINKNDEHIVKSLTTRSYADILDIYRKEYARFLRNAIIKSKAEIKQFKLDMLDLFKDYWPHFEEEAKTHALAVSSFIEKSGLIGQELWDALEPKIISEQYFKSERLNLSGIIDVIEVYGTLHVPVELKTGKFPDKGVWDNHRVQLGVYMMLLEDAGKQVSEGVLRYKGAQDKRVVVMDSMLKSEISSLARKAQALIDGFDIPEKVTNPNKCAKCSFRDVCHSDAEMVRLIDEARKRKEIDAKPKKSAKKKGSL